VQRQRTTPARGAEIMHETLLCESLGEDTTTQLYRDADGGYHVRVMSLPEGGGEKLPASRAARVFTDQPVSAEEARALFGASAAQRYVEATQAFPGAHA
jgi:hypothetical protein